MLNPSKSAVDSPPVLVCGAGAAGMAAAIAAARAGREVVLVELGRDVGGTLADALLHTIAGLYDGRGALINGGLAQELVERLQSADPSVCKRRMGKLWVLNVDPNLYREVTRSWLASEPLITTLFETSLSRAWLDDRTVVDVEVSGSSGCRRLPVHALIDTTGSAAAVSAIDPRLKLRSSSVAAGGWVFRMRGIAPGAFVFPRNVALVRELREAASRGNLPAECERAWIDTGVYADEVFVKLFVPLQPGWQKAEAAGKISAQARAQQQQVVQFLRTMSGFENASVTQTGRLGVRDGGRVRGEYVLRKSDVVGLRRFEDAACRCAWPIEYWDSKEGVSLTYLPDGEYYEIPMRALKVRSLDNVWTAGKSISADVFAQASARCVGTCWAMGEAAGAAAARSPGARPAVLTSTDS
jgi:hypothetical protein